MMPDLHPGSGKPSPFFIEPEDMKQKRQAFYMKSLEKDTTLASGRDTTIANN